MRHTKDRLLLFLSLLWRRYDRRTTDRISWRVAWRIARDCTVTRPTFHPGGRRHR